MEIKKQMILRDIAGENVLVPTGSSVADTNGLFMLTETAAFIWNILAEVDSSDEIAVRLTEEYDISYEDAKNDSEDFLDYLRKFNII